MRRNETQQFEAGLVAFRAVRGEDIGGVRTCNRVDEGFRIREKVRRLYGFEELFENPVGCARDFHWFACAAIAAQKLRHKRTNTIAVSLDFRSHRENHIADPFIFDLLAGVSEALGDRNQDLLLCAPNHNDAAAFRQMLNARGADGFIILGQGHREQMLNDFAATGAPLVVWGAEPEDTDYCVVGSDNFLGGQLAGRYFVDRGRRHFLFVGDTSFREFHLRREGLKSVADEHNGDVVFDDVELRSFSYESAYDGANRYLDVIEDRPDAVFAYSDTAAMAFISALRDHGIEKYISLQAL